MTILKRIDKILIESKMNQLHVAIQELLKKNPKPSDKEMKALASKMGIPVNQFKEYVKMVKNS